MIALIFIAFIYFEGETMKVITPKMKEVNIDDVAQQSKGVATIYAWLVGMMEERSPNWNSK